MILENIGSPRDLKSLTVRELTLLSDEIRARIGDVVCQKGGHLASSLGAVELCVALHACFNSPTDTIIFDVGHQTYAHKILTGRRENFDTLREEGGISGFPHCRESEHDAYISGHASTAVSWAQGVAEGKKLKRDSSKTIAVIGDGSLTGGMCFEALNNCGHMESDVLVVLNHNEMSISPSVGALSNYLNKIISAPVYNRIKSELETFLSQFSLVKRLANPARKFEEAVKGLVVPGIFFEELGFRYFGPIDGHDIEKLVPTLMNVRSLSGPRIVHVVTQKGKGSCFCEQNPEDFHSAPPCNQEGVPLGEKKETFSETFANQLTKLAAEDKRIVAITAAMPKGTGLNVFGEQFPQRFFDVGIAEEHAVGFASGLAKSGQRPVVAIYSTFLQRSFDQIIHDVCLQNVPVFFALDRAGLVGADGPTHHGVFDIGYLRMVPNMVCMAAKDKQELEAMVSFGLTLDTPVSVRYPKGEAYSLDMPEAIHLGKAQVLREGSEVCIIGLGSMVKTALEAGQLLAKEGVSAGVVNARFIKPLDEALLTSLASEGKLVVTLEEGALHGGFGSAVLECYEEAGLLSQAKVLRVGLPDEFIPHAKRARLFELYKMDAVSLASRIKKILKHEQAWQK